MTIFLHVCVFFGALGFYLTLHDLAFYSLYLTSFSVHIHFFYFGCSFVTAERKDTLHSMAEIRVPDLEEWHEMILYTLFFLRITFSCFFLVFILL